MFILILDSVEDFHTVEERRLHRIFGGLRRKRHIACDEFFMLRIKNLSRAHSAAPRFRTGFAALDSGSDWDTKYPD